MRYFFYLGEWIYNKISLFTLIILISIGYCHSIWLSTAVADDIPPGCGTNFCICPETRNQCNPGQACDSNTTMCANKIKPGEECCPSNKPNNTYSCSKGICVQDSTGTLTQEQCYQQCTTPEPIAPEPIAPEPIGDIPKSLGMNIAFGFPSQIDTPATNLNDLISAYNLNIRNFRSFSLPELMSMRCLKVAPPFDAFDTDENNKSNRDLSIIQAYNWLEHYSTKEKINIMTTLKRDANLNEPDLPWGEKNTADACKITRSIFLGGKGDNNLKISRLQIDACAPTDICKSRPTPTDAEVIKDNCCNPTEMSLCDAIKINGEDAYFERLQTLHKDLPQGIDFVIPDQPHSNNKLCTTGNIEVLRNKIRTTLIEDRSKKRTFYVGSTVYPWYDGQNPEDLDSDVKVRENESKTKYGANFLISEIGWPSSCKHGVNHTRASEATQANQCIQFNSLIGVLKENNKLEAYWWTLAGDATAIDCTSDYMNTTNNQGYAFRETGWAILKNGKFSCPLAEDTNVIPFDSYIQLEIINHCPIPLILAQKSGKEGKPKLVSELKQNVPISLELPTSNNLALFVSPSIQPSRDGDGLNCADWIQRKDTSTRIPGKFFLSNELYRIYCNPATKPSSFVQKDVNTMATYGSLIEFNIAEKKLFVDLSTNFGARKTTDGNNIVPSLSTPVPAGHNSTDPGSADYLAASSVPMFNIPYKLSFHSLIDEKCNQGKVDKKPVKDVSCRSADCPDAYLFPTDDKQIVCDDENTKLRLEYCPSYSAIPNIEADTYLIPKNLQYDTNPSGNQSIPCRADTDCPKLRYCQNEVCTAPIYKCDKDKKRCNEVDAYNSPDNDGAYEICISKCK